MNWGKFFSMGGYAPYVWSAYAIAAAVLSFNVIQPILRRRNVLRRLKNLYRLKGHKVKHSQR